MFVELTSQRTGLKEFLRANDINHVASRPEGGAIVHGLSGDLAITLAVQETPALVVELIQKALANAVRFPHL